MKLSDLTQPRLNDTQELKLLREALDALTDAEPQLQFDATSRTIRGVNDSISDIRNYLTQAATD